MTEEAFHVTIKDVAKRAGVSIATVSFVLNNTPDRTISEKVRKRVVAAATELNYSPRASAVGLAGRRTRNVAVVFYTDVATVSNAFHAFVVQGVIKETIARDYNLLFAFVGEYNGQRDLPKVVRERNAEGVLFLHLVDPEMVADLQGRGIKVALIDPEPQIAGIDTVQFDARRGGAMAVEHLLLLGHKHIAALVASLQRPSVAERGAGFEAAFKQYGVPYDPRKQYFVAPELTYRASYEKAKEVLCAHRTITALFCANDEMAAGALRAARELGRRVPQDLSVVGFDDVRMASHTDPPLTTISVRKEELGRVGMGRLITLIEGGEAEAETKTVVLPVELVHRESSGRAP